MHCSGHCVQSSPPKHITGSTGHGSALTHATSEAFAACAHAHPQGAWRRRACFEPGKSLLTGTNCTSHQPKGPATPMGRASLSRAYRMIRQAQTCEFSDDGIRRLASLVLIVVLLFRLLDAETVQVLLLLAAQRHWPLSRNAHARHLLRRRLQRGASSAGGAAVRAAAVGGGRRRLHHRADCEGGILVVAVACSRPPTTGGGLRHDDGVSRATVAGFPAPRSGERGNRTPGCGAVQVGCVWLVEAGKAKKGAGEAPQHG